MNFETINFELNENGIGILSLNRPDKLNAINFQMEQELHELFDHLMINLDCRVLILRAEGRAFCSGTDLQEGLILNKKMPAGTHKVEFNGSNLASGVYFYQIKAGQYQDVKKMAFLK